MDYNIGMSATLATIRSVRSGHYPTALVHTLKLPYPTYE